MKTFRLRLALWPVAAAAFYALFIARTRFLIGDASYFSLFDDAMISMRYARNLAGGFGPVWNPGDAPVEGFTNPLWTLWMAALHTLSLPESKASLAVMISGAVLLLVGAWLTGRTAKRVAPGSDVAVQASIWVVALCYPLVFWTLRGMEVGLLAALVGAATLAVYRLEERPSHSTLIGAALLLAILPLARPDGAVAAAVLAASLLTAGEGQRRKRNGAVLLLAVVASAALATAARLAIFGEPLPNTYYLKMMGVSADERIYRGVRMMLALLAVQLWPLLVLAAANGWRIVRWPLAPLAGIVVAQLAYSVYVGGDAWEWMRYANRYVSIALPALVVLAAVGATRLRASASFARRVVLVTGLGGGVLLTLLAGSVFLGIGGQPSFFQRVPAFRWAVAWSGFLGGGALVAVGVAASLGGGPMRARVDALLRGFAGWSDARLAACTTVVLLVWLSGPGLAHWVLTRGVHVADDAVMTRIGVRIRETTDPRASIAVTWAGAIPYFAHRRAVDLLGKNDRRIAHERARGPFYPGHNKWDYSYSIGELRPDVIVQLGDVGPGNMQMIVALGYVPLSGGMLVRHGTRLVDAAALQRPVSRSVP